MKKIIAIIILLIVVGAYLTLKPNNSRIEVLSTATYSSQELGLEFDYKTGPGGYVIDERIPVDIGEHLRTIIIYKTEDKERIDAGNIPEGGEGPPAITVTVLKNTKMLQALNWAEDNIQYSHLNLKMTDPAEVVVGGANAVRYMADGLYVSDTVVVTHGGNIYVLNGQYLEADSDLKKDFSPIVDSVRFIPFQ